MKTFIKNLFLLTVLIAGLGFFLAGRVTAQTLTTLHNFTGGSDGAYPWAGVILSGNTLYGTAYVGGNSDQGTVFAVNTDGTSFTNLYSFTALSGPLPSAPSTNSDGARPFAGLVLSGNTLYGTAKEGGSLGWGTVFAVNTDGTGFTNLHSFTPINDGANPYAGLILSGNTLYGTTYGGSSLGEGTVFAVNTDGTDFTTLHNFNGTEDGGFSYAGLILSGNTLYGAASVGGVGNVSGNGNSGGTVFAVNTNGTGFRTLHSFTTPVALGTNSDGENPFAGLILSGNTLYGTAYVGGDSANGTVFAVNTDGTGFTNLHSFTAVGGFGDTNSDGAHPQAGLILSGNTLYGTANHGGSSGRGTVFAVNTDGTGFTTLHDFNYNDGTRPLAGLVLSGNTLYGTTVEGGSQGLGTVFSLSFAPQLTMILSGAYVILTWPTNTAGFDYTGFSLQSTTDLVATAVWSTNSPAPTVVNGQNTVTNPVSGAQKFYRLSQ